MEKLRAMKLTWYNEDEECSCCGEFGDDCECECLECECLECECYDV